VGGAPRAAGAGAAAGAGGGFLAGWLNVQRQGVAKERSDLICAHAAQVHGHAELRRGPGNRPCVRVLRVAYDAGKAVASIDLHMIAIYRIFVYVEPISPRSCILIAPPSDRVMCYIRPTEVSSDIFCNFYKRSE